jgi:predicted dehydrogenase
MCKYTAVQIGLGARGLVHLHGLLKNSDSFDVVGICDLLPDRLQAAADRFSIGSDKLYDDAERMMRALKPDVMSFTTLPHIRKEFVEMAVKYGVKGLLLEKPMETTIDDAKYITDLCAKNNIKAVVCHQHKYLSSFLKLKEILDSGELGGIYKIDAACQAWLSQLGTHYMDYILWANGGVGAVSVVGHIHGKDTLRDTHPSPDYIMGEAIMGNGVRANIQCGYFTKPQVEHHEDYENYNGERYADMVLSIDFWMDDRLTVYGETGYAWAECNGRWGAFTSKTGGKAVTGVLTGYAGGDLEAQERYTRDFAAWLDDDAKIHPSHIGQAFHGYEILEAMCLSALDKTRVDLPLVLPLKQSVLERMATELPEMARRKF